jgi:hypothetical protein
MADDTRLLEVAAAPVDEHDWSFEACQLRLRKATAQLILAERHYDKQAQRSADAEAVYRFEVGKSFGAYREKGEAVEAARIAAHKDCMTLSRERDYSADLVKLAMQKIENARESRSGMWALISWAHDRELTAQRANGAATS